MEKSKGKQHFWRIESTWSPRPNYLLDWRGGDYSKNFTYTYCGEWWHAFANRPGATYFHEKGRFGPAQQQNFAEKVSFAAANNAGRAASTGAVGGYMSEATTNNRTVQVSNLLSLFMTKYNRVQLN